MSPGLIGTEAESPCASEDQELEQPAGSVRPPRPPKHVSQHPSRKGQVLGAERWRAGARLCWPTAAPPRMRHPSEASQKDAGHRLQGLFHLDFLCESFGGTPTSTPTAASFASHGFRLRSLFPCLVLGKAGTYPLALLSESQAIIHVTFPLITQGRGQGRRPWSIAHSAESR